MSSPHLCLFFFSSRRRHTRSTRDWSSDVCSSDLDQMKQAFYNVIKNSLEAMHRHGTLRIRTDMDDTHVIIRFVDTGGGMSAENLSRVFEPYFTTKPSGTGLGLLIVRRIVREHGGELSIESPQGKGLTVTIRLPY